MNKKIHNKKTKQIIFKNNKKTHNKKTKKLNLKKGVQIHRNIYSFDKLQEAGGLFDILIKTYLKARINNFIDKNKLDLKLYNLLIGSTNMTIDTKLFKKHINLFLFSILQKFYFLLREHKNNILFNNDKNNTYKYYKYKYLYKYKNNKLKNDKLLNIINSFIDLLFNNKSTIYPLPLSYSSSYTSSYTSTDINNYFTDKDITKESIKSYINSIIVYDNSRYSSSLSSSSSSSSNFYFKYVDNKVPKINYKDIQYIKKNNTYNNNNKNNINYTTNKDKVFLIIYINFSSSQKNNSSFKYDENISENEFYILENSFIKIQKIITNYFKNKTKDDLKKSKRIFDNINNYFFNNKFIDNYANFLLYYYKSQIFTS